MSFQSYRKYFPCSATAPLRSQPPHSWGGWDLPSFQIVSWVTTVQNTVGERQCFRGTYCLSLHQRWWEKTTIRRRKCVSDLRKTTQKHCQNSQPGQDKPAYFWNIVWHHYCYNQLDTIYLQQKQVVRGTNSHIDSTVHTLKYEESFQIWQSTSQKVRHTHIFTPKMQNDIQYWSQNTWPEVKKYNL
jgi:hypothetical protein